MTGTVNDETGSPIANALVGVQFFSFYGDEFVWETTRTDSAGRYQVTVALFPFDPLAIGKASLEGDEYEPTIQLVPTDTTEPVRNFRLRRIRHAAAGESVTISMDAESGLCTEIGVSFSIATICETARVTATRGGILTIDVRPAEAGGVVPVVALDDRESSVLGSASTVVQAGETYRVRIQVPIGTSPGEYIVSTSTQ